MATPAQLAANRANAQRSTGPRSVEGKSVSRFNALQHGADAASPIIPGEDPAEYQELADEYLQRFAAPNPGRAIPRSNHDRFRLAEAPPQPFGNRSATHILDTESPGFSLAAAILTATPAAKLLARTQRQLAAHQRVWYRAFTELRRQREREADEDPRDSFGPELSPAEPEEAKTPERTQSPAPKSAKSWPPWTKRPASPSISSAETRKISQNLCGATCAAVGYRRTVATIAPFGIRQTAASL